MDKFCLKVIWNWITFLLYQTNVSLKVNALHLSDRSITTTAGTSLKGKKGRNIHYQELSQNTTRGERIIEMQQSKYANTTS